MLDVRCWILHKSPSIPLCPQGDFLRSHGGRLHESGFYNLEELTLELVSPSCSLDDIGSDVDTALMIFLIRILRDRLETEVLRKSRLSLTLDIADIFDREAKWTREHESKSSYLEERNQG